MAVVAGGVGADLVAFDRRVTGFQIDSIAIERAGDDIAVTRRGSADQQIRPGGEQHSAIKIAQGRLAGGVGPDQVSLNRSSCRALAPVLESS